MLTIDNTGIYDILAFDIGLHDPKIFAMGMQNKIFYSANDMCERFYLEFEC